MTVTRELRKVMVEQDSEIAVVVCDACSLRVERVPDKGFSPVVPLNWGFFELRGGSGLDLCPACARKALMAVRGPA